MRHVKYLRSGLLAAALALSVTTTNAAETKAGFILVGPVGDHGWSYQHDQGRLAMAKNLGIKTTVVESVKEGADAERVIRKLATSGYNLIFTTSFGYMNSTLKVAKQFPKVKFEHATGYKRSKNVSTYGARFYEGRYVAGILAGRMTKSNIIGYIGSFPIPEVVRGIDSFTIALRKVNPKAVVKVIWVNSWYDPGKESDAAKTLVDQGADVLLQHTDSAAPLQTAESRGVWGIGQASDMSKFAPKAQLTAIVDNWGDYYTQEVKAVMDGSWKSADTWGGLKAGMVKLAPYNKAIPAAVVAEAEAARKDIIAGELRPFDGPIKDQSGKVVVASGETLSDQKLLGLNFYVQGVQGSLPK